MSELGALNAPYVADLYRRFQQDPNTVDSSWQNLFAQLGQMATTTPTNPAAQDSLRALTFIQAIRANGHLAAQCDPLGLAHQTPVPSIDPTSFGFDKKAMDRPIALGGILGLQTTTMHELQTRLGKVYCGSIGVEFSHIQDPAQKWWIQEQMENADTSTSPVLQQKILQRLTTAEAFEEFLQKTFPPTQRYSLQGAEALLPALDRVIETAANLGVGEVVLGMSHRGRLNILCNLLQKPFATIFAEFQGNSTYDGSIQGSGDIKYHLGASIDRTYGEKSVHLTLNPNPSHLECVDPVVAGRVRAKQQRLSGDSRVKPEALHQVMGLILHGDAAFAGQGVVAETFMLGELKGYRTGGTLHIVINNQIGFTTHPKHARSGIYCTDVAKMVQAPIFHVNGDDVDAVLHVAQMAAAFRQTFHKDVVIDLVCYRRHGHSENDEPAFTQPVMVRAIGRHPTTREIYADKLAVKNTLPLAVADAAKKACLEQLEKDYRASQAFTPDATDWLDQNWSGMHPASGEERSGNTGVDIATLRHVGAQLTIVEDNFHLHPKLAEQIEGQRTRLALGRDIDWGMAEALAFGTLALDRIPVRLSGQDSKRGSFSQRHAVLFDQHDGHSYTPLRNLAPNQAPVEIHDSPLSELAVLGFDYGFSLVDPNVLVIWEAQFGDFANGAQVMIDQFISSAEGKWLRQSGIVLLLPHGYEGQGAEHSSARIERYLQNCAEDNWQVANCTTPANYFHILRRQIKRDFRKPLILMTPKGLLSDPRCVSNLCDMEIGTKFQRIYGDKSGDLVEDRLVRRVVLCSGKVYYDLEAARRDKHIRDVALIRIEQLYPFPQRSLEVELLRYPKADFVWCQEESENMGAWNFVAPRITALLTQMGLKAQTIEYVGRAESAAPACGLVKQHRKEQIDLINKALTGFF